ncbi:hypothetical protein WME89_35225 [Sorangium sp. So ce321]|uniref:hypothetical protein n=1 Tax=Sorangium sp. So ce321 TaxID=3133300 RepID=UPI003F5DC583
MGVSLLGAGGVAAAGGGGCRGEDDCVEDVLCEVVNEDGTSNRHCWGQCVRAPMGAFGEPVLVWTGPETLAPSSCDDLVRVIPETGESLPLVGASPVFVGRALPIADHDCPACDCMAPGCALPSGVTARSRAMCGELSGDTMTPFPSPPGWDGSCVSPGFLAPEQFGSLTIAPVQMCVPFAASEPSRPLAAGTGNIAIACSGHVELKLCPDPSDLCMLYQQQAHLPDGWRHCVVADDDGTMECPHPGETEDPRRVFSEKLSVFYDDLVAAPACTPCGCDAPTTNGCEALLYAYEDRACSDILFFIDVHAIDEEACVVPEPSSSLGSLSATWLANDPERCTPRGGEPFTEVKHGQPKILCCLPRQS